MLGIILGCYNLSPDDIGFKGYITPIMENQMKNDLEDEVMKSKLGTYRYCVNECMAGIFTNPLRISS